MTARSGSRLAVRRVASSVFVVTVLAVLGVLALRARPVAASPGDEASKLLAGRTISGTVVDSDKKPAAGIAVKLLTAKAKGGPAKFRPGGSPTGDAGAGIPDADRLQNAPGSVGKDEQVLQASTTDSAGKFAFRNVPAGFYQVLAGTGAKSTRQPVTVSGDVDPDALTITVPK